MQFKAVIFDLGDTLILTDKWDYDKCLANLLKSLHNDKIATSTSFEEFKRVYFEVRNKMYLDTEQSLKEVDFQQRVAETLKKFNFYATRKSPTISRAVEAFTDTLVKDLRIENYIPSMLAGLREKHKLGLVTNFAYAPGVWKILKRFNLTRFFDAVVVSGEIGIRKPHPLLFKEALRQIDRQAEEAVFIGDSLKADINGAKKVGFKTVLVENAGLRKNPYAVAGELEPFPVEPDVKIPNLKHLSEVLDNWQSFMRPTI
ncbi:MAG: HAD family hydrolase [Candidatus Bathyarchaeia archaeon]